MERLHENREAFAREQFLRDSGHALDSQHDLFSLFAGQLLGTYTAQEYANDFANVG
jgi:hypothetical protein